MNFASFGALNPVPGLSPGLVMEAIQAMTFDLVLGRAGVAFTGANMASPEERTTAA